MTPDIAMNLYPEKEIEELRAKARTLDAVIAELLNYELNGSDAPAQIRGIYSDLEEASAMMVTPAHTRKLIFQTMASTLRVYFGNGSFSKAYWNGPSGKAMFEKVKAVLVAEGVKL